MQDTLWPNDQPLAVLTKGCPGGAGRCQYQRCRPTGWSDWNEIGLFEKVRRIEEVLDRDIRPMLASDGGGMDLVDLRETELHVQYNGACGQLFLINRRYAVLR